MDLCLIQTGHLGWHERVGVIVRERVGVIIGKPFGERISVWVVVVM